MKQSDKKGRVVVHLVSSLRAHSSLVSLIHPLETRGNIQIVAMLGRHLGGELDELEQKGVRTLMFGAAHKTSAELRGRLELLKGLWRLKPEVVHSWQIGTLVECLVTSLLLRVQGRRCSVVCSLFDQPSSSFGRRFLSFLRKYFGYEVHFLWHSHYQQRRASETDPGLMGEVVPLGVAASFLRTNEERRRAKERLGLSENAFLVGCPQVLPPHDFSTFCRAASLFVGKVDSVCFILPKLSHEEQQRELEALTLRTGIKDYTKFVPAKSPELAGALDICTVMRAQTVDQYQELLRAMSSGTLCVVSEGVGAEEFFSGSGFWFLPGDVDSLLAVWMRSHAMSAGDTVIVAEELQRTITESFTLAHTAERLTQIYSTLS